MAPDPPADDLLQRTLDALPIAVAIVGGEAGDFAIECRNGIFARLDALARPESGEAAPILARNGLSRRLAEFIAAGEARLEFDWLENDSIAGRHFSVTLARLGVPGQSPSRTLVALLDRTVEVQTERNLRREMLSDSLTGLPNRSGFDEQLEHVARKGGKRFAVLVVDLVRFSRINESIGTIGGDELIITVARRLVAALRAGDSLARTGGDEFGLLVRDVEGPEAALQVARRVEEALAAPFRLSELEIRIACSIGITLVEPGERDLEKPLRHAQFALKRAKESGRTEIYQPTAFHLARKRFSLETELRRAIERERLSLAFQPLVDLASDRVTGFEALARWEDPVLGVVSPTDFIPVAEESGLIVPLGRWALGAAGKALAAWDRQAGQALPITLSVNLSAIQLARDNIPALVADMLGATGIAGHRFTLELTESAVIADPERAIEVFDALKHLNATLAMDDFGTGYSCLAYLQRLPLDILKIDRSFITGMLADRNKVAIVRAVLSLADALGMKTTAEGIESHELAQTLSALGCATGQGYYYSGPLDAASAYAFLVARNC